MTAGLQEDTSKRVDTGAVTRTIATKSTVDTGGLTLLILTTSRLLNNVLALNPPFCWHISSSVS